VCSDSSRHPVWRWLKPLLCLVLSPTRFIIDCLQPNRDYLLRWGPLIWLIAAVVSILVLQFIVKPQQPLVWSMVFNRWYVLLLLYVFPWSRIVEVVFAFLNDTTERIKNIKRKTSLTIYDRLRNLSVSYLELIIDFGILYFFSLPMCQFSRRFHNIFESVYFSTITITTTGYGDITPRRGVSELLCMFELIAGLVLVLGGIGTYMASIRDFDKT
jgi:hypothetical protein